MRPKHTCAQNISEHTLTHCIVPRWLSMPVNGQTAADWTSALFRGRDVPPVKPTKAEDIDGTKSTRMKLRLRGPARGANALEGRVAGSEACATRSHVDHASR